MDRGRKFMSNLPLFSNEEHYLLNSWLLEVATYRLLLEYEKTGSIDGDLSNPLELVESALNAFDFEEDNQNHLAEILQVVSSMKNWMSSPGANLLFDALSYLLFPLKKYIFYYDIPEKFIVKLLMKFVYVSCSIGYFEVAEDTYRMVVDEIDEDDIVMKSIKARDPTLGGDVTADDIIAHLLSLLCAVFQERNSPYLLQKARQHVKKSALEDRKRRYDDLTFENTHIPADVLKSLSFQLGVVRLKSIDPQQPITSSGQQHLSSKLAKIRERCSQEMGRSNEDVWKCESFFLRNHVPG